MRRHPGRLRLVGTSEERNHFDARLLLRLFKIVLILEGAGKIIATRLF